MIPSPNRSTGCCGADNLARGRGRRKASISSVFNNHGKGDFLFSGAVRRKPVNHACDGAPPISAVPVFPAIPPLMSAETAARAIEHRVAKVIDRAASRAFAVNTR